MNILTTTSSFRADIPGYLNVINNPYKRQITEDEAIGLIEQYQPVGLIAGVEPLTRKVMEKAKNLKVISRCGIGIDSVDLDAAEELGIKVVITPEAPMVSVAELTMGLILSLIRRINTNDALIRRKEWKGPAGNLLSGKMVGIIGCGRIGSYVAKLLTAFDCRILGYDLAIKTHNICKMVSFNELIANSDIVSLHIPYSEENHHIINAKVLNSMKKSALLINAARGGLIDEEALYWALENGIISGAALDCFESEPYLGKLTELENTVFTPHMGSSALEARAMMEKEAVDNLIEELNKLNLDSKGHIT